MKDNYTKVDILKYVKEGLESGIMVPFEAVKFARILAREGIEGEVITTYSVDADGKPIVEKVDTVKKDDKGRLGMVVTKADENGKPIVDANGNKNEWIIGRTKFDSKYDEVAGRPGFYQPKGGPQIFVEIPDNIILYQWGDDMKIAAGGYINITNISDMYGISQRDFADTYKKTTTNVKVYKIQ